MKQFPNPIDTRGSRDKGQIRARAGQRSPRRKIQLGKSHRAGRSTGRERRATYLRLAETDTAHKQAKIEATGFAY